MFGREATEVMWISEFEPHSSYSVEAESGGAKYLTRFDFSPEGAGTRVVMLFGAEGQTFFAKLMGKLFFKAMAKSVREALKQDMDELKQLCEADV
ncbi:Polyketide cyclase / dehydrase and lipid transport [compost metagenome]